MGKVAVRVLLKNMKRNFFGQMRLLCFSGATIHSLSLCSDHQGMITKDTLGLGDRPPHTWVLVYAISIGPCALPLTQCTSQNRTMEM